MLLIKSIYIIKSQSPPIFLALVLVIILHIHVNMLPLHNIRDHIFVLVSLKHVAIEVNVEVAGLLVGKQLHIDYSAWLQVSEVADMELLCFRHEKGIQKLNFHGMTVFKQPHAVNHSCRVVVQHPRPAQVD